MKALAIFIISLLVFQTVLLYTSIVTEARPLLPIMENPKNSFVKNIYDSPKASRPKPSPAPPSPQRAPPPKPPTFIFIQDFLQLSEKSFPSSNLILMFTTLMSTATETRAFQLILGN
ncbi:hypothetical protein L6164_007134 [Bauhinia variegata]|uniref:Uncharacterized protein n=1 Tax=Bauhinia variegata TaxID=167791 RepID=A0ACB9PWI9_BAUVA|nr:hypothetical protein L6164_007134 [Bauhinia variegata]